MKQQTNVIRWSVLALVFLFLWTPLQAQDNQNRSWEEVVRSWSLEFRPETPDLHVSVNSQGDRTTYLYIPFTLRNNFDSSVPLNLNFALRADDEKYYPVTSEPFAEREIIVEEANLRGYSKGVQDIKIKNLKQNGRFLNYLEIARGVVLRKNLKGQWKKHNIKQLDLKPIADLEDGEDNTLYGVHLKAGPEDQKGKPYAEVMARHPAEIKGLLLFKNVDLTARKLTLKVGGLMDNIVRVPSLEVPKMKRFMLKPRTLHITWTWNVPRNMKMDSQPEFHRRRMIEERFGPLATRDTLKRLVDFIAMEDDEFPEGELEEGTKLQHTLRSTAIRTLRTLTEENFNYDPQASPSENEDAIKRWKEWWFRNKHDLLYVVDTIPGEDQQLDEDLFHTYPKPKYIVIKKKVGLRGAEDAESLFQSFREAWNNEQWQTVVDHLIVDQRGKETLEQLLDEYGYGTELGYSRNIKDNDTPNQKVISFNFKETTKTLLAEQDGSDWYIRVPRSLLQD